MGGFGAVYRAVQPLVEREVAVKIILLIALARTRVTRTLTADECQTYLHGPCPPGARAKN